jgi:ankyrin repeat protein
MKRSVSRIKSVSRRIKSVSRRRKSVRRKSVRRKSVRRKSVRRKSVRRKSVRRKSVRRKSVRRKSVRGKSVRGKSVRRTTKSGIRKSDSRIRKSVRRIRKSVRRTTSILGTKSHYKKNDGMDDKLVGLINLFMKYDDPYDKFLQSMIKVKNTDFDTLIVKLKEFKKHKEKMKLKVGFNEANIFDETLDTIAKLLVQEHDYENFEKFLTEFPEVIDYYSLFRPRDYLFLQVIDSQYNNPTKDYTKFLEFLIKHNVNIYRMNRGLPCYNVQYKSDQLFDWVKQILLKVELEEDSSVSPLFSAINNQDIFLTKFLVSNGANINRDYYGMTPLGSAESIATDELRNNLMDALTNIDVSLIINEVCKKHREDYAKIGDLNQKVDFIKSKFEESTEKDKECLVDMLFELLLVISSSPLTSGEKAEDRYKLFDSLFTSIDKNIQDKQLYTPLMYLLSKYNMVGANKLIDMGADPCKVRNLGGDTGLKFCVEYGDLELVRKALGKCGDLDIVSEINRQYLLLSAINSGYSNIVTELLDRGADVNIYKDNFTPVILSISSNFEDKIVKRLIDMSNVATINLRTRDDFSALSYAIGRNRPYIVKLLLDKGAEILRGDASTDHVFIQYVLETVPEEEKIISVVSSTPKIIDLMLDKNPEIIHNIMANNNTKTRVIINNLGANKNRILLDRILTSRDENGNTPLINAINSRFTQTIKTLLKNGADINAPATNGDTPLMKAIISFGDAIATRPSLNTLFNSAIRNTDKIPTSALSIAIKYGYVNVVDWLLDDEIRPSIEIRDTDIELARADNSNSDIPVDDKTRRDILRLLLKKKKEQEAKPTPVVMSATTPVVVMSASVPPPVVVTTVPPPVGILKEKVITMYKPGRFRGENFLTGILAVTCYFKNDFLPSVHGLWPDGDAGSGGRSFTLYPNQTFILPSDFLKNSKSDTLTISDTLPPPYNTICYLSAFKEDLPKFLGDEWLNHGIYAGTGETIDDYFTQCFVLARPVIELLVESQVDIDLVRADISKSEKDIANIILNKNKNLTSCFNSATQYFKDLKYCLDLKFNVCAFETIVDGKNKWVWKFVNVSDIPK